MQRCWGVIVAAALVVFLWGPPETSAAAPAVTFAPGDVDFGEWPAASDQRPLLAITITNSGDAPLHPPIHRWVYPNYIVYFERNHVINSVAQRATPLEIGVKNTPPETGGGSTPD